jgi:DNA-binding NarL/FixJ family response regulator
MKSVYILDDHDIVRFGLEMLVASSKQLTLAGSAASLAGALDGIEALRPDLVISDMSTQDSRGLDTVRAVVQAQAGRAVLVVSMHDELVYGEQVIAAGARGYLMKESAHAQVLPAALQVLAGGIWVSPRLQERLVSRVYSALAPQKAGSRPAAETLTPREIEVLERIGQGKTTKEIAFELALSARTVDLYRTSLKRKLGLRTSAELIAYSLART